MPNIRPKICVIVATPMTIQFFFSEHLVNLAKWAEVHLLYNNRYHTDVVLNNFSCKTHNVSIERKISLRKDAKALLSILKIVKKEKFDLVITLVPKAGFLGMLASWICGVENRLHIFQGEVWSSKTGIVRHALRVADIITAKLSTCVLAVSHSEKNFLIKENVVPAKKIDVINAGSIVGVKLEKFKPNSRIRSLVRAEIDVPNGAYLILYVGRLAVDKGLSDSAMAITFCVKLKSLCIWL